MNQPGQPVLRHRVRPPEVRPSMEPDLLNTTNPGATRPSAVTGKSTGHPGSRPTVALDWTMCSLPAIVVVQVISPSRDCLAHPGASTSGERRASIESRQCHHARPSNSARSSLWPGLTEAMLRAQAFHAGPSASRSGHLDRGAGSARVFALSLAVVVESAVPAVIRMVLLAASYRQPREQRYMS